MSNRLNEFELIRRYFTRPARGAALGVGDDAALLAPAPGVQLAVTTDALIEGRHFRRGAEPRALGHKALAVNLSDLAAMGARPRWALLALALPRVEPRWLAGFAAGLFALARRHKVDLVGGDTTRGPLMICVTVIGEVPRGRALLRSAARPGDDIWVSGELGGAALALAKPRLRAVRRRLHQPEPRVALGLALRGIAHAAIDVSDGFAQDLGHVLERSKVGASVDYDALPRSGILQKLKNEKLQRRCVLSGGDDYELVFTAGTGFRERIRRISARLKLKLTRVGRIEKRNGLQILDASGRPLKAPRGFDHFAR